MDNQTCSNCFFWLMNTTGQGPDGWCRRYPPTIVAMELPNMPGPTGGPDVHSFMPSTRADLWCGEYRRKTADKAKKKKKSG